MRKETLELIERIKKDLKEMLSEHRYNHSIGVMNKAIELAKIYGIDEDKAALAGLTHDIAKEIPEEEALKIVKKNNIKLDEAERLNTRLLHGPLGAFIAKEKYGADEQIQNAIKYHAISYYKMDLLAKITYIADKTEETRKSSPIIEVWRKIASKDIDQAIIMHINYILQKKIEENGLIPTATIETRNKLLMDKIL